MITKYVVFSVGSDTFHCGRDVFFRSRRTTHAGGLDSICRYVSGVVSVVIPQFGVVLLSCVAQIGSLRFSVGLRPVLRDIFGGRDSGRCVVR